MSKNKVKWKICLILKNMSIDLDQRKPDSNHKPYDSNQEQNVMQIKWRKIDMICEIKSSINNYDL